MFAAIYHTEDGDELVWWSETREPVEARVYYLNKYAPQMRDGELIETTLEELAKQFSYRQNDLAAVPDCYSPTTEKRKALEEADPPF